MYIDSKGVKRKSEYQKDPFWIVFWLVMVFGSIFAAILFIGKLA